jgi:hypothetical protein
VNTKTLPIKVKLPVQFHAKTAKTDLVFFSVKQVRKNLLAEEDFQAASF